MCILHIVRSRQSNQNKAVSRADKAIDEDSEEDEDLMCFDGKTGGRGGALWKWDLQGVGMTCQH